MNVHEAPFLLLILGPSCLSNDIDFLVMTSTCIYVIDEVKELLTNGLTGTMFTLVPLFIRVILNKTNNICQIH